jgi:NAD(P)-dependent dehydrogenase (short-subunit alcohol dehydrogenase family)
MKLKGKSVIVTGSSQGFGLDAAKAFVREGANVAICARGRERLQIAQDEVTLCAMETARIIAMPADVSRPEDVYKLVEYAVSEFGGVDVLLCNAGVYGPKGPISDVDWTDWAKAVEINLNGTALPCRVVIPHMKKKGRGRIIIMSGGGATKPLPFLSAYAASKAAVVRFAETLAEELTDFQIYVNAVAPGALNTRMLDEVLEAGPGLVGQKFYNEMVKLKEQGGTPLEVGTSLCVFLASDESEGITGKLISAVWDPWREFPDRLDDLKGTDIFTLRRIIPEDRGKNWA